jgi:hypothetical protein
VAAMIGDRLEARLRLDPDGDPRHQVGRVWARVGTVPTQRVHRPVITSLRPIGTLLAVAVLIAVGLVVRPIINPPGHTPTPSPSPTPLPTFNPAQLKAIVDPWMITLGPVDRPPISVTVIGSRGVTASYTLGTLPASPPEASTGRIGELSRVYVAAAIVTLDACAQTSTLLCAKPIETTMRLDDPVARWWPPWPDDDPTTVRMLLEGTSGLAAVSPSLTDLAATFTPGSGPTLMDAAVAAPRRFTPGSQRSPVDTEWLILDAIIPVASGQPAENVIPTDGFPPFSTSFANQPPLALMAGSRGNHDPVADLDPALLEFVGNSAGISASSEDLAGMAVQTWGSATTLDVETVAYLTDAANGRQSPIAALGGCPCDGNRGALLVHQIGHAIGWTSVMAYSWDQNTAIGIVMGRDWRDQDVEALLHDLTTVFPG